MYEANPIAFLTEQAGGIATDGASADPRDSTRKPAPADASGDRQPRRNGAVGPALKQREGRPDIGPEALIDRFGGLDQLFQSNESLAGVFHAARQANKRETGLEDRLRMTFDAAAVLRFAAHHDLFRLPPAIL